MLNDYSFNHIANCCLYLMDQHKKGDVFLNGMIPYVIYGSMVNIHFPLTKGLEMAIVPNDGADSDILINDLKKIAAAEFQDNMQPTFYEICDRLPRTPAGKIDYQALEQMADK